MDGYGRREERIRTVERIVPDGPTDLCKYRRTDERTNGRAGGWADGQTDGGRAGVRMNGETDGGTIADRLTDRRPADNY